MLKNTKSADADFGFASDVYSRAELDRAVRFRQAAFHDPRLRRRDKCPHAEMCPDLNTCVRYIAWYFRHQREIEGLDVAS